MLVGSGDDLVYGGDGNDFAAGGDGDDRLLGNAGSDYLDGGLAMDRLEGGAGDDTYEVDSPKDLIVDTGGTDTVVARIHYTLKASLENLTLADPADGSAPAPLRGTGNALPNRLTGNSGDNLLNGLGGVDVYVASAGNDTYMLDALAETIELIGPQSNADPASDPGIDTVVHGLAGSPYLDLSAKSWLENATLTGKRPLSVVGNGGANQLIGNSAANTLRGGNGDDWLDGGLGNDILDGGPGNDTFVLSAAGDQIIDAGGIDTVKAPFAFNLVARPDLENLTLLGTANLKASGNDAPNVIAGNRGANVLSGGAGNDRLLGDAGNDTLDGGSGNDMMEGGAGNDTYLVDSASDQAIEATAGAAGGIDLVKSSAAQSVLGDNVENLSMLEAALRADGNALANLLQGNAGDNELYGLAGNDRLFGNAGNDLLHGGAGDDSMIGGPGNDVYYVDSLKDTVTEGAGPGSGLDIVWASIGTTLRANVEGLFLAHSAGDINATGNGLDNAIYGNPSSNLVKGLGGNDLLVGMEGTDKLAGGPGNDQLWGDSVMARGYADQFVFDTPLNAATNVDVVGDFEHGVDLIVLRKSVFTALGSAGAPIAAEAFSAGAGGTQGADASDRIIYDTATGSLYYDRDGSGAAASVQFATLGIPGHHPTVDHSDFLIGA